MLLKPLAAGVYALKRKITPPLGTFTGAGYSVAGAVVEHCEVKASPSSTKKKTKATPRFQGRGVSLDGSVNRVFRPRRAPKRQFSRKQDPPGPSPFTGRGLAVGRRGPVSSRGRALRKPSAYAPADAPKTPVSSITRRCKDGRYKVVAFLTEDELISAGAGRMLTAFKRGVKK
jgi:hypothetical protein